MINMTRRALSALLATAVFCGAAVAAEPEKPKLSLGVGSSILGYTPVPLAATLGYFKQEGLDVTVENFQAGGSKALQALLGGSVDAVVGSFDHTIQMQAQGKEVVGVFLLNVAPGLVIGVRQDLADRVKSGKDFKGLKVGVTTPGSSTDMLTRYYISRSGLNPHDVEIIAVGSGAPGMVALENKNVDVLGYYDPIATQIARKGSAKVLFDLRTPEGSKAALGGLYPFACLYVTRPFLEKNPETVQRLADAFLRTQRWIAQASPEKIVETLPSTSKVADSALNVDVWRASKSLFSTDGIFDAQAVKTPLNVLSSYDPKIANARIDLSKTYTNRFAEEAAKRIK